MNNEVTIITYHYVRDLKNSRFPNLKGLDYQLFKDQIEYIVKNYNVITMEQMIDAAYNDMMLPDKAVLLAFDDGYIDHYTNVFPVLNSYGIQGSFFIPVRPLTKNIVLDVNKIHYLLESFGSKEIMDEIYWFLKAKRKEHNLKTLDEYYAEYVEDNRFDDRNTMFVKRFLQNWDKVDLRTQLINELFEEYFINENEPRVLKEAVFNRELYMNMDQIKSMHRAGMYIGAHTYHHYHLGSQTAQQQRFEIATSIDFLKKVGTKPEHYTMSYPYGSHNETTKKLLKESYGFKFGISIKHGIFSTQTSDHFDVPRIDCNDITKEMNNKK